MAGLVHRLTKNTPSITSLASSLKTHSFPKPTPSLIPHLGNPPKPECPENPFTRSGPATLPNAESPNSLPIFLNLPFGYCLNPISPSGFSQLGAYDVVEAETDDARTVWADSVKKKRKRKMNKHKLKKLRKSLRRKSRA